jgi:hypothetical protein
MHDPILLQVSTNGQVPSMQRPCAFKSNISITFMALNEQGSPLEWIPTRILSYLLPFNYGGFEEGDWACTQLFCPLEWPYMN